MTTTQLTSQDTAAITDAYRRGIHKAKALYGDMPVPTLLLNLRGRAAGQWRWRMVEGAMQYQIRLNPEAYRIGRDHLLNETIPHEIAHHVCHVMRLGNNHDAGWRRVARSLGCAGNRCHNLPLKSARRGPNNLHTYRATCGTEIVVSPTIHARIQRGQRRVIRKTGGTFAAQHYVGSIIG